MPVGLVVLAAILSGVLVWAPTQSAALTAGFDKYGTDEDLQRYLRDVEDHLTQVIEQVAYTWFNRFSALRFMDANGYTVQAIDPDGTGPLTGVMRARAGCGRSKRAMSPSSAPNSRAASITFRFSASRR